MAAATDLLSPARFGYLKPTDVARLAEAYRFSEAAHAGQTRQSGDPYISHPLAVAEILADWHLDGQTLMAALLHDVTEDTSVTKDEISDTFGKPVAELVDGVSKLDRIEFQSAEDAQAENFRKMLLAMARDVRVMLIKLADRLHNMRTLGAVSPAKRRRVARETMEIYAPIANRLGLNTLYHELQELAFSHLYPTRYRVLAKATKAARGNRREMIGRTLEATKKKLADSGIQAKVFGREKHVFSTYRKMIEKHLSFSEVHDIFGLRVIVADVPACYLALGALHGLYKPIPGKFKDYIAIPKANGYQSIHTDLIGPYGVPVEVQIRTDQMHRLAESGVASHWMYKDDADKLSELQKQTHRWLQSLLEIQHQSGDPQEFLEHVKVDLFPDEVYVFTPKGRILSLPRGATTVDFAYAVHTDIGNRCVAAKVNGELVPLRTELRNGDRVEIITASHAKPSPGWLQYVRTGKARSNIRHFLKTMQYEESAGLGERLLDQALRALKGSLAEVEEPAWERVVRDSGARSREELLADIGLGKRLPAVVARRLTKTADVNDAKAAGSVTIRGTEGMAVQLATCCRPIPGDAIVGSIKKGQGLVVHGSDCVASLRSRKNEPEQWIDVEWDPRTTRLFQAAINVTVENQRGVLAKVASEIADAGSNIDSIAMGDDRTVFTAMHFVLEVRNRQHLARVMRALRRLPDVQKISRTRE
ncbi:MAG TPA: bifunctional (p)ppGpp synthetase/guanosine-3',5'-bis(diphosphate) 3'-pyrophosphohydrolase [Burkholderiales bacterium]|jgi:guanosine-3',5'-bis(diphosphate) 3'-pyrophosphohydrolase|nr:bifunctional (p)ppGpp synthetase/guanosine-3',5'-bis(diphosphate) 3'-pyrophosphohydrolase [Burkholderiales bacterium]